MRRRRDRGFEQFYRSTKDDLVRALIVAVRDRALAERRSLGGLREGVEAVG
jgi:hypothetical protein